MGIGVLMSSIFIWKKHMPDNNQNTTSDVPPILEVETNLPPMIHEQSSPPTGSAAPNDDVIMPAVVTTTQRKNLQVEKSLQQF